MSRAKNPSSAAPKLAPPGQGLPTLELVFSRFLFRGFRLTWTRASCVRRFTRDAARVLELVERCDQRQQRQPVLSPRLIGMEDSSRFWSPLMVLEHMFIVDRDITAVIRGLCRKELPADEVEIAALKPRETTGPEIISVFRQTADDFVSQLPSASELRTDLRYAHPWFGPLNGHDWLCMAAMHHTIHRRQMERIVKVI